MPNISQRGIDMPESPIRKLVPLAERAKARGVKVYHLNIGQPDLPTPECGLEAMRHIDRKVLEYSPSEGIRSFREKLVTYYAKFNIRVEADDIIITAGGSEAVRRRCSFPSWLASTRATKSSCPNPRMPTTWRLPFRVGRSSRRYLRR